jgi:hypothetical protein
MTRVLLICGSLQRASANRAALDVARASLSTSGVEVSEFEGLRSIPPLNPDRTEDPGGEEKARRIRERYDVGSYEVVYAYGDTKEDEAMLALAHKRVFRWQEV